MKDLFDKFYENKGPLGKWAEHAEGYFVFPKLEGHISNRMKFQGKDVITWSINDYLGLANHPDVREVDAKASQEFGSAYPMGARMMSGHTSLHEQLQQELAAFVNKEASYHTSRCYGLGPNGRDIDIAAKMLFDFNELASKIITHRFPIDDAQEAFRTAADRKSGAIKVVLDINI